MRLWVVALAFLWSSGAWADNRPLVVGVEEQGYFPDYGWQDGGYHGAGADILNAFATDNGYTITFRPVPIRRLILATIDGTVDLKFPDSPEWGLPVKKGAAFVYSNPMINFVDGVVVRADQVGRGIDSFHTLGTLSGFTVPEKWQARIDAGSVALKENTKLDQLLRQVQLDRIDGAYVSVKAALYVAETELKQKDAFAYDPGLPHRAGSYRVSSVSHPELIEELNRWMGTHKDTIKAILVKWNAEIPTE